MDPPCSIADALKGRKVALEGELSEFDYEPFFPIALVGTRKRAEELENHRLRREYSEDVHLLVTSEDDVVGTDSFE